MASLISVYYWAINGARLATSARTITTWFHHCLNQLNIAPRHKCRGHPILCVRVRLLSPPPSWSPSTACAPGVIGSPRVRFESPTWMPESRSPEVLTFFTAIWSSSKTSVPVEYSQTCSVVITGKLWVNVSRRPSRYKHIRLVTALFSSSSWILGIH